MALGRDELPAIKPDASYLLQRLHHGHCIREPVALTSPRHIEHGQADGPVAPDDPGGRRHLPAGSHGDPAPDAPDPLRPIIVAKPYRRKNGRGGKKVTVI